MNRQTILFKYTYFHLNKLKHLPFQPGTYVFFSPTSALHTSYKKKLRGVISEWILQLSEPKVEFKLRLVLYLDKARTYGAGVSPEEHSVLLALA